QLQAMDLTLAARGERHPDTALIFQDLANIYLQQGEYPRALELYERALKDLQLLFGPESNEAANAFYNLGLAWTRMGGYDRAREALEQARSLWELRRPANHPVLARVLDVIAVVLMAEDKVAEAEARLERSLAIREASTETSPVDLAWTLA